MGVLTPVPGIPGKGRGFEDEMVNSESRDGSGGEMFRVVMTVLPLRYASITFCSGQSVGGQDV